MIVRAVLALLLGSGVAHAAAPPKLLPAPGHMIVAAGTGYDLTAATRMFVPGGDAGARNAAERLAELLASQRLHLAPPSAEPPRTTRGIHFVRAPAMAKEAYRLVVDGHGATITASDDAGLLYGGVTLWQLATQGGTGRRLPPVTIDDAPRFGWRGLMLDSARHFQSPAYVRALIDWMAANKLNRLHWHLVDDQGWRIQIRRYPRLTDVSAWRTPATAPGAPALPRTGGFYTQAEIRAVVAYAQARGVTIVPEIEMPGHATAAIRAYPALGMGVPLPEGVWSGWGVFPWLYNPDDATFAFLEDVLGEVMALFPSPWIHVGGDEATKDQWRASPAVQAKIKALGLKDEDALQGWFTARIGRFLAAHGRRLIGWDEILDGGVPASATVMSWRGIDGAIATARAGHDAVLSPAPVLYFDNRQGAGPDEPPGRGALVTLADVLAFDPMPAALAPAERRHILGLQGNLWTEHVRTEARAAWMTFPRAAAIAEIGWSPAGPRDLAGFVERLMPQLERMRPLGLNAAYSAFAVTSRADRDPARRTIGVTLANQAGLPIRYTLDGSAPSPTAQLYTGPLTLTGAPRLRATALLGDRVLPGALDALPAEAADRRSSRQLETCSAAVVLDLEDDFPAAGERAHFLTDIMHPCWIWRGAPLDGVRTIRLAVGQVPFNFQLGKDLEKIRFRPSATPDGEFEVRAGGCDGDRIATLPLAPARGNPGVTRLETTLPPRRDTADLCITYTVRGVNPMWALDSVALVRP